MHAKATRPLGRAVNAIEETLIALILGAMTIITFANVVARYVFNANILWALETTVFLFAWLVLLGASYCVKTRAHLGVDVVLHMVSPGAPAHFGDRLRDGLPGVQCLAADRLLELLGALRRPADARRHAQGPGLVRGQRHPDARNSCASSRTR